MLTKAFARAFIPAVIGSPEIPARPEYTVCQPPAGGSWQTVCERIEIPRNGGIVIPPGGRVVTVYDPTGAIDPLTGQVKVIDVYIEVCASQWVPAPAGDPVCTTYPAQPYVPEVPDRPARWEISPVVGWDAGANSVITHDADCELKWTMNRVVGAYVGLTEAREEVPAYDRLTHAFYFHQRSGVPYFRITELGQARSHDTQYAPGDEFAVRRVGTFVTYWHNGTKVQDSPRPSTGEVSAGCALYASGDALPSAGAED